MGCRVCTAAAAVGRAWLARCGLVALALALGLLSVPTPGHAAELTVSVAASLREAVEALGRAFAQGRPGLTLRYNLGASGELQKQIEAGAPVDVFLAAGPGPVDALERAGLILPGSRRVFAGNVLVALKPVDSTLDLPGPSDLLDRRVRRIAIGNPRTVPAGQYAEESLRALGLWERVRSKLVLGENVRQVLDWVVRGEVDVGVVYATDGAARLGRVRLAFAFPSDTHRPIAYVAAVVAATRQPVLAREYVDWLAGREAQTVLARFGFEPPPAAER
jgi:molybdate transport system substrate-binding protein